MNCHPPSPCQRLRPVRLARFAATLTLLAGALSACGGDGNNAGPSLGGTPGVTDHSVSPVLRCAP